jgi:hypothetical protein
MKLPNKIALDTQDDYQAHMRADWPMDGDNKYSASVWLTRPLKDMTEDDFINGVRDLLRLAPK